MLHYIDKEQNKKYTFIPQSKWIDYLKKEEKTFENDVYTKYSSRVENLQGELIECVDLSKLDGFCKKIIKESYQDYQEFISKRDFKKEQWVYNILDGKAEQESILYQDDLIVILPNYTWKYNPNNSDTNTDLSQMYLLTFPKDKLIHSLRDLNSTHLELLEHIQKQTFKVIKNTFGFDSDIIKSFVHYSPTTYHLHIHWVLISNTTVNSSVEYSHNLTNIISNIGIKSNYYQSVILDKRI
jgi:m7GpppX diphosphatase